MGPTLIVAGTMIWVLAILIERSKACKYWRENERRVTCPSCESRAECTMYDKFGINKKCQPYEGPDRRNVSLVVQRQRNRELVRSA